jgi:hypothetical protein
MIVGKGITSTNLEFDINLDSTLWEIRLFATTPYTWIPLKCIVVASDHMAIMILNVITHGAQMNISSSGRG